MYDRANPLLDDPCLLQVCVLSGYQSYHVKCHVKLPDIICQELRAKFVKGLHGQFLTSAMAWCIYCHIMSQVTPCHELEVSTSHDIF